VQVGSSAGTKPHTSGRTTRPSIRAQEAAIAVKVFVSSTYIDLKDHRQRVIAQVRRAGYHVDPMEDWTSDANEPRLFSLDRLDGCQACVLLVGFRRGFVPEGQERSITQMEYDYAIAHGIDVLPFLLDDGVTGWPELYDDRTTDPLLKEWREYLGLHHGIERFTADPTSVDVLPVFFRWQAWQYEREQMQDHLAFGGRVTPQRLEATGPASRNRRAMIEKVWAIWITGVLQPSLPHDILLDLGLTEHPAMVTRTLDLYVQRPELTDQAQAPTTRLIDAFNLLDQALLILGAPGTGKTTLLLTLARDLLQRAAQDQDQPIPVYFPLSSWAKRRRPLADWLVDALNEQYDVPRKTGQAWVDADQILPLLDGLDEVKLEHRAACVETINAFRQEHGLLPIVVCSRLGDYEPLGIRLRLQGALVVQPLTREQVGAYLAQIGQPLAAVCQALQEDPLLWELLDTPLMLTIVTLAYAGLPTEALRTRGTLVEQRQSLFATYVSRMFQRRGSSSRYTRPQTERWLAWLAWQLAQHSQTVFYLERLQPDWLPVGRRWLPTHGARLLAGVGGGMLTALAAAPAAAPSGTLLGALLGALIGVLIGAVTGYSREITPIETVRWSWLKFLSELLLPSRRSLRGGLGVLLGTALFTGLTVGLGVGVNAGQGVGLGTGLIDGLVYKLYAGLVAGLWGGEIATKTMPNEGIHHSVWVAVSSGLVSGTLVPGLVSGLGVTLVAGPGAELSGALSGMLATGLFYGSFVGLATGLKYGGRACLQHLVLRLSLRYYDCIPRHYVNFLDYAVERLFLRRVGGGYIFIHRLLQEYFATMHRSDRIGSPPQPPPPPP
jgi:DNA polymerase III delta prime subunit